MKKHLFLAVLSFTVTTVKAQYWHQYTDEGDELKGTKTESYHAIKVKEGVIRLNDNEDYIGFLATDGFFDYETNDGHREVYALFGMYDESGNLVGKEKVCLSVPGRDAIYAGTSKISLPKYNHEGVAKVATWIREKKGIVRFIIPRYGKSDFDVTLPTMESNWMETRMGNKFKIEGEALLLHRNNKNDELGITWTLEGKLIGKKKIVSFRAFDKTGKLLENKQWENVNVAVDTNPNGKKRYFVSDSNFYYLKIAFGIALLSKDPKK